MRFAKSMINLLGLGTVKLLVCTFAFFIILVFQTLVSRG